MSEPKVYLLDIEGTVAPISLVTEALFPYARAHFAEFLETNVNDESIAHTLLLLMLENRKEQDPDAPRIRPEPIRVEPDAPMGALYRIPQALKYLYWLMDHDRKSTALKILQGRIWKTGFENGELEGVLFDDVPPAFERWSQDARVAIYSSGSVEAQQLLFRHSNFGDLTGQIASYFDTTIGQKRAAASYAAIAKSMEVAPDEVLFFSDVVAELDAAREAGCQTRLVVRPGNAPAADANGHLQIGSFTETQ